MSIKQIQPSNDRQQGKSNIKRELITNLSEARTPLTTPNSKTLTPYIPNHLLTHHPTPSLYHQAVVV
jgi:hypothetical protein